MSSSWRRAAVHFAISPAGRPAGRAGLGADDAPELPLSALEARVPGRLAIDDFEVPGSDHPLAAAAEVCLEGNRDTGDAIFVAWGVDEVASLYRGVTAMLRKSRSGLLLAPRSSADGGVFTARLPRSVGGPVFAGRVCSCGREPGSGCRRRWRRL